MKRMIGLICIAGLLYIGYQWSDGYVYWQEEIKPALSEKLEDIKASPVVAVFAQNDSKDERDEKETTYSIKQREAIIALLAESFSKRETNFTVTINGTRSDISSKLTELIDEAIAKDDYTYYVLKSYSYTSTSYNSYSIVKLEVEYRETLAMTEHVREQAKTILQKLDVDNKSIDEKVKLIHDFIVRHVQYDEGLTKYTAYEALFEKEAVCQGYALLGYMMLKEAGIPVRIAEGSVKTGEHAWVMVQLDGKWFHLDLTWDDPIGQTEGNVSYKYYLVSDEKLKEDHSWVKAYPKASISYTDLLEQKMKEAKTEKERNEIMALRVSLDMHWNDEEYTISSKKQLNSVIRAATKKKETTLQFRYVEGKTLLDELNGAFKAANMALSYQVNYSEWSTNGDVLVTIQITYKT